MNQELSKKQAAWWMKLCLNSLDGAADLSEAVAAADLAVSVQPDPPENFSFKQSTNNKPVDAFFAHDMENPEAQAIYNKAMEAAKKLSAKARKELTKILSLENPNEVIEGVVKFLNTYKFQLAKLLSTTQLAALLQGAREVAAKIPIVPPVGFPSPPPTLPPQDALKLVEELRILPDLERAQRILDLPPDQQAYTQMALHVPPPIIPPYLKALIPGGPGEPDIHFPVIEEAAHELSQKNVMDRAMYDALDSAARAKAFTVAGVDSDETLAKIRDVLAKNVQEGADFKTFKKEVLEAVGEGTFLSDSHLENIFRTNVQSAFSDGQMKILNHPYVADGFPYVSYFPIEDDRVRHNHLALEKLGIDGSNVYRITDPVFKTFRPPWDYNCRCGFAPMTVMQAAAEGIREAIQWLQSGQEPFPPAFVPMPPFQPPPGFQRDMALSIRLSMLSEENWNPADHPRDWETGEFIEKSESVRTDSPLITPVTPIQSSTLEFLDIQRDGYSETMRKPDKIIGVPDLRQPDDFSCGACATLGVSLYYGVGSHDLNEVKATLGTSKANSTDPDKIVAYLNELGLDANPRHDMTLDELKGYWCEGNPVIACIKEYDTKETSAKYGHFVTVVGHGLGMVMVQDPSIDNVLSGDDADQYPGIMPIKEDRWLEVWHDSLDGKTYHRFGIVVGPGTKGIPNSVVPEDIKMAFVEAEHPRGQENNPGQFTKKPVTAKVKKRGEMSVGSPEHAAIVDKAVGEQLLALGGGETNTRIRIADLRNAFAGGLDDAELNAALWRMMQSGKLSVYRLDDPREITAEDKKAALRTSTGEEKHIIYYGGESSSLAIGDVSYDAKGVKHVVVNKTDKKYAVGRAATPEDIAKSKPDKPKSDEYTVFDSAGKPVKQKAGPTAKVEHPGTPKGNAKPVTAKVQASNPEFESQHPRGQPENAGQFAKKPVQAKIDVRGHVEEQKKYEINEEERAFASKELREEKINAAGRMVLEKSSAIMPKPKNKTQFRWQTKQSFALHKKVDKYMESLDDKGLEEFIDKLRGMDVGEIVMFLHAKDKR